MEIRRVFASSAALTSSFRARARTLGSLDGDLAMREASPTAGHLQPCEQTFVGVRGIHNRLVADDRSPREETFTGARRCQNTLLPASGYLAYRGVSELNPADCLPRTLHRWGIPPNCGNYVSWRRRPL